MYILQIFEDVHLHKKPKLAKALEIFNYIFAAIFTMEFILKAIGFGLIKYFSSAWNCLDAFIVSVSSSGYQFYTQTGAIKLCSSFVNIKPKQ